MKVLMYGPGKGHNAQRFLKWFSKSTEHQLTYFYFNKANVHWKLADYSNIPFISYTQPFKLISALRKGPDLLWVHNWTPIPFLLLTLLFRKRSTRMVFNVWSEPVPIMAGKPGLKGAIYRKFFRSCDLVMSTWYSTWRHLEKISNINLEVRQWGLEAEFFEPAQLANAAEETKQFVAGLPQNRYRFFFPKSVNNWARHELIIEAANLVVQRGVTDFAVYIWTGNHNDAAVLQHLKDLTANYNLQEQILFPEHSFLSNHDMQVIWQHMHCGLQIVAKDQLSTSFTEPMLLKRELLAIDLYPYKVFDEKFDVQLNLVTDAESLANRMQALIQGNATPDELLEKRRQVILNGWQFEQNMPRMLQRFNAL